MIGIKKSAMDMIPKANQLNEKMRKKALSYSERYHELKKKHDKNDIDGEIALEEMWFKACNPLMDKDLNKEFLQFVDELEAVTVDKERQLYAECLKAEQEYKLAKSNYNKKLNAVNDYARVFFSNVMNPLLKDITVGAEDIQLVEGDNVGIYPRSNKKRIHRGFRYSTPQSNTGMYVSVMNTAEKNIKNLKKYLQDDITLFEHFMTNTNERYENKRKLQAIEKEKELEEKQRLERERQREERRKNMEIEQKKREMELFK